ncbi:hypothetical protein C5S29_14660 [ANME-1 cluster archaeon GoMg3.2]|nr:hypothetical protein [ANME-1 cluster archaeon GoMg3.2]
MYPQIINFRRKYKKGSAKNEKVSISDVSAAFAAELCVRGCLRVGGRESTSATVTSVGEVLQFVENIELTPLAPLSESYNFSVNESPSIAYEFAGAKSVGKAYRFYPEGVKFEVPIRVTLPLNVTGVEGELFVIARDESGNTTFIVPEKVDGDSKAVTFCTRHFSVFEPYGFPTTSGCAYINLNVRLDGDYEESPSKVELAVYCEEKDFLISLTRGIGSWQVIIPALFLGEYKLMDAYSESEHFLFETTKLYSTVRVTEAGATYGLDVPLVAASCRMTGTVRDTEGNPVEDAKVMVKSDFNRAFSKGDGSYTIEDIFLKEDVFSVPYPNMEATYDCCAEYAESEEKCPMHCEYDVTLRAGKTKTHDFRLFDGEILINGEITDMNGEYIKGAKVEITDSAGNKDSYPTDFLGYYLLIANAEGKAEVKATCENGKDTQTKIVDLKCKEDSQVDFVLDCSKGNYSGYYRAFFEAGDPNGIGGAGYQSFLDEYDFTFDIDDDGMINGSGWGYSEWEISWRYDEYKHKERVTCKTGPMPFSVEIRGQREGNNLLLEPDFYSDAHVIWDCTPSGEAPLHEGADFGVLRS